MAQIEISKTTWAPTADAGSTTVTITAIGDDYLDSLWLSVIQSGSDWLSCSPILGTGVTTTNINVTANTTTSARTGVIRFYNTADTTDGTYADLTVTQAAGTAVTPTISISPTSLSLDAVAGVQAITITTSAGWTLSFISGSTWITPASISGSASGTLYLTFSENTGVARTGSLRFYNSADETVYADLTVTQAGVAVPTISLSQTTWDASAEINNLALMVTSSAGWTAGLITDNSEWITFPDSGEQTGSITVRLIANTAFTSRTGTIRFYNSGDNTVYSDLVIVQAGISPTISISKTTLDLTTEASTNSIDITTNAGWSAFVNAGSSWISIEPKSGTESGTAIVTVAANTGAERTGNIRFYHSTTNNVYTDLVITQDAYIAAISITPTTWNADRYAATQAISITVNNGWSASITSGSEWLLLSATSGTGSAVIAANIIANTDADSRTGTIRFTHTLDSTIYADFTVTQKGVGTIIEKDGIKIVVPEFGWAFNPIIVGSIDTTGNNYRIWVSVSDANDSTDTPIATISRVPKDGKMTFDLSGISQLLFNRDEFYKIEEKDTTLFKTLKATFKVLNKVITIGSADINVIWGGMQIGETFNQNRTYRFFKGYPFTIPLYLDSEQTATINDTDNILSAGKYNLPISADTIIQAGDNTIIKVEQKDCTAYGDIYLRWLNARSEWCYYLFKQTSETIGTEVSDIVFEQFYDTVSYVNGHHAGTGQYVGKSGTKMKSLTAVFLDANMYEYISSIATSPIIDMYDNGNWMRVKINDTDIVKSSKVLQDISIEIVLPDMITQKL